MFERLIAKIARSLDDGRIPYMIVGGQAVLLYGRPRLTRDIDITLGIDTDRLNLVVDVCKKIGLKILPEDPEAFTGETKVLPAEEPESAIRVDFVFSFTEYEAHALERVNEVTVDGYPVKFASCEDVILHKVLAGRAVDMDDVLSILAKQGGAVDIMYIRKWLGEFGVMAEYAGVLKRFDEILNH